MVQEFRYRCPVETWRLLGFVGIMFVGIITFQHFVLPSSSIISYISSSSLDQIAENGSTPSDGALLKLPIVSNATQLNVLNSTAVDDVHGRADDYGNEKDASVDDDSQLDPSLISDDISEVDNHEKQSSIQPVVRPNVNSTWDPVENSDHNRTIPEETGNSFPQEHINFPIENTIVVDGKNESSGEKLIQPNVHSTIDIANRSGNNSAGPEENEQNFPEENSSFLSENNGTSAAGLSSIMPPPEDLSHDIVTPAGNVDPSTSTVEKDATPILEKNGKASEPKNNTITLNDHSPVSPIPRVKTMPKAPISGVVSFSEMHNLLLQSWSSPSLMRPPRWASPVDRQLLNAKLQIENAPIIENDPLLYAPLYWNVSMFKRSYELMEEILKVYVYKEGEKPILHQPVLKGIYSSEGWFMKFLESNKKFVTKKPRNAHLFYLPFSSRNLELQLYVPDSHSSKNLVRYLKNYLDLIVSKHPFWNRTDGADHFLVACHDWAPGETKHIMSNTIRSLCNADVKGGFVFGKDASLPETNVRTPQNPLRDLGGKPPSQRSILAFFAGSMHGYLRPILLKHWENKDPDMKIFARLPKARRKMNYFQYMKSSKYCICAKGYEVNSPRVMEAIMYECVPVIISDNYVPPFFEVLNWESFAVFVLEKDIPNLKNILLSIPEKRYRQMQLRVKKVQQHFLWHSRPVKYDLFHMILHSVWFNRVFQMQPR